MSWLWKKVLGTDSELLERLATSYGFSDESVRHEAAWHEVSSRYEGEVEWEEEATARAEQRARKDLIKILHALLDASGQRRESETPSPTPASADTIVQLKLGRSQILMPRQGEMGFCMDVGLMKFVANKKFPPSAPVDIVVGPGRVAVAAAMPKWSFKEMDARQFFTAGEHALRKELELDVLDGEQDDGVVTPEEHQNELRMERLKEQEEADGPVVKVYPAMSKRDQARAAIIGDYWTEKRQDRPHYETPDLDYSEFEAVLQAHEDINIMKGSSDIAWRTGVFDFDVELRLSLKYSMWADSAANNAIITGKPEEVVEYFMTLKEELDENKQAVLDGLRLHDVSHGKSKDSGISFFYNEIQQMLDSYEKKEEERSLNMDG